MLLCGAVALERQQREVRRRLMAAVGVLEGLLVPLWRRRRAVRRRRAIAVISRNVWRWRLRRALRARSAAAAVARVFLQRCSQSVAIRSALHRLITCVRRLQRLARLVIARRAARKAALTRQCLSALPAYWRERTVGGPRLVVGEAALADASAAWYQHREATHRVSVKTAAAGRRTEAVVGVRGGRMRWVMTTGEAFAAIDAAVLRTLTDIKK